jgi:hypothetical protein
MLFYACLWPVFMKSVWLSFVEGEKSEFAFRECRVPIFVHLPRFDLVSPILQLNEFVRRMLCF